MKPEVTVQFGETKGVTEEWDENVELQSLRVKDILTFVERPWRLASTTSQFHRGVSGGSERPCDLPSETAHQWQSGSRILHS